VKDPIYSSVDVVAKDVPRIHNNKVSVRSSSITSYLEGTIDEVIENLKNYKKVGFTHIEAPRSRLGYDGYEVITSLVFTRDPTEAEKKAYGDHQQYLESLRKRFKKSNGG